MRLFWIFLTLAGIFFIPFAVWGGWFDGWLSGQGASEWLEGYGRWAWVAGLVLLSCDLILPIPGTAVMAALGLVYGPVLGGLISAVGSVLSGVLAYVLCRGLGRRVAEKLAGRESLDKGEVLFSNSGAWLVVLSRWLPLMPEVIACMAGLSRMSFRVFMMALVCGSVPLAFVFSTIGAAGEAMPMLAVILSIGIPPVLWLLVRPVISNKAGDQQGGASNK
ncbi:MAG: VTT domain-containing protein, partial [Verrucomicrobiaceae bacterium]|nr:VTT domain-containing protein [Verrucomicrobiaceae bacterium]